MVLDFDICNGVKEVRIEESKVVRFQHREPDGLAERQLEQEREINQMKRPVRLGKRKMWRLERNGMVNEEEEETKKPRLSGEVDVLALISHLMVFNWLDVQSLVRCMAVSKPWNSMVRSEAAWCWTPRCKESWVLITTNLVNIKWTSPDRACDFPLVRVEGVFDHYKVVAADGGLVCIMRNYWPRLQGEVFGRLHLAVGNPVTQQWRLLPETGWAMFTFYSMVLLGEGEFRVGVGSRHDDHLEMFVYDSVTDDWTITKMYFPPVPEFKYSFYDLRNEKWMTNIIHSEQVRTGLEQPEVDPVHLLAHPFNSEFCMWEHQGDKYFASGWSTPLKSGVAGLGVWKFNRKEELELVDAAFLDVFASCDSDMKRLDPHVTYVTCKALYNLVCFAGAIGRLPVVIYDLSTHCWSSHAAARYVYNSRTAVAFSPSFAQPALGSQKCPQEITE